MMRIGFGYDAHPLVPGRPLILGGVTIPHELGLAGHSDADVVAHALCDALLGALALGDLGTYFPSSEARWRGVSSLLLLQQVTRLVRERQYVLGNADITIVAQRPKLSPYIEPMIAAMAAAAGGTPDQMSIKATTTDGLGFVGLEAGIAAYAICLLRPSGAAPSRSSEAL
jgi:2-C-methyl-D-erythritol 2,4-cyclodiphosphate synthase